MSKYIDAEKLIAAIEKRRLSNRYIDTEGYENELLEIITSLQEEQAKGIDGIVHHSLHFHWIVTDKNKLAAILEAFPEGAKVELFICAKKEKPNGE